MICNEFDMGSSSSYVGFKNENSKSRLLYILKSDLISKDITFDHQKQGAGWSRIFLNYKGCSIGRYNFKGDDLFIYKYYKPDYCDVSNQDFAWYQVYFCFKGYLLTKEKYDEILNRVQTFVKVDLQERKNKRKLLPQVNERTGKPIKRKRLLPKNIPRLFASSLHEAMLTGELKFLFEED